MKANNRYYLAVPLNTPRTHHPPSHFITIPPPGNAHSCLQQSSQPPAFQFADSPRTPSPNSRPGKTQSYPSGPPVTHYSLPLTLLPSPPPAATSTSAYSHSLHPISNPLETA